VKSLKEKITKLSLQVTSCKQSFPPVSYVYNKKKIWLSWFVTSFLGMLLVSIQDFSGLTGSSWKLWSTNCLSSCMRCILEFRSVTHLSSLDCQKAWFLNACELVVSCSSVCIFSILSHSFTCIWTVQIFHEYHMKHMLFMTGCRIWLVTLSWRLSKNASASLWHSR
jgi:hypothetical protein